MHSLRRWWDWLTGQSTRQRVVQLEAELAEEQRRMSETITLHAAELRERGVATRISEAIDGVAGGSRDATADRS